MTRTQKKFVGGTLILAILLVVALAVAVVPTAQAANADPLPSLTNVTFDDGVLSWDAFEGAESYHVAILGSGGNGSRSVIGTSCNVSEYLMDYYHCEDGEYRWYVYAETDNDQISRMATNDPDMAEDPDRDYYDVALINYRNTQTPLAAPTGLIWDHTIARWDEVENAQEYGIDAYVYDPIKEEWELMNAIGNFSIYTYYDFAHFFEVDKKYRFSVKAYAADGDPIYKDSEEVMSAEEGQTFPHVADALTNVTLSDGKLNFDDIEGEDHYDVSISTGGGFAYSKPIDLYKFCEGNYETGDYDVEITVYNANNEPLAPLYTYHNFHWDTSYGRQPITGTPIITGTPQYGQTLTVNIEGVTYSGTPKYTWFVENTFGELNSTGAAYLTENTYTVSGYIGLKLKVCVETDENIGAVWSEPTSAVLPSEDALTGTVTIDGNPVYGNTLSAYLEGTNNPSIGYLKYQWKRNGANISGATGRDYRPGADDIGKTLSVVITSDCYQGSRMSDETATVGKGRVPAPSGLGSTRCTSYENNDGTITGVNDTMEYKLSTASEWTDVTGTTITGLVPGEYYVRYKESSYIYESDSASVTVTGARTYSISIVYGDAKINGTIVEEAPEGATITIVAEEPDSGYLFDCWVDNYSNVTFADVNSSTTTFTMVADNVSIMANYTGAPLSGTVTISGVFKYDKTLHIETDTNNTGAISYQWRRNGVDIEGATNDTYNTVEADVGQTITVRLTSNVQTGYVESSPTQPIAKADGGNAPWGLDDSGCTTFENNNGTITNVDETMEYKFSTDSEWTSVTGTTITGLIPGTYLIRFKETSTHMPSSSQEITIDAVTYHDINIVYAIAKINDVEVNQAANGHTVTVIADAPSIGYVFDYWSETWDQVTFDDIYSTTTTFTMVDNNVWIRANYKGAPLSGTVVITGTPKYNQQLEINMNTNGCGSFYYQWTRDNVNIDGATSHYYTLTEEDIGHEIRIVVCTNIQTGSITSASVTAIKADGNTAPTSVVAYKCTTSDNNDGEIAGLYDGMEYRVKDGVWADVSGSKVENLVPGTYEVRWKGTATHNASAIRTVVVNAYDAPIQYTVSVDNGVADPVVAVQGTEITVTANAPADHYEFDKWVSVDDEVEFADENASTTTFVMPEKNVTVTATYKLVKHAVTFNANEGGTGEKAAEQVDHGALFTLPENPFTPKVGKGFSGWAYASDGEVITGSKQIQINADTELFAIWVDVHVHTMEFHAATVPTCTTAGNNAYYECTDCHNFYSDEAGENQIYENDIVLAALGHEYEAVVTAPTCTASGYTTHTCPKCGHSYLDAEVAPLGHNEVIDQAVSATCTESGLTQGKYCSRCNEVLLEQTTVPATGHDWGDWEVTTPAQVGVDGVETRVCSHDENHKETRPIDALPYPHREETDGIVFEATMVGTTKDVASLFAQAKAENGEVEITAGSLKLAFNAAAVDAIGGGEGFLTVNVFTSDFGMEGLDDIQTVVEINFTGAAFAEGSVRVELPFTTVVPNGKIVKVYYVDGGGNKTDMNAVFDGVKVTFDTNHFSKFAIVFEDAPSTKPTSPTDPTEPTEGVEGKGGLSSGAIAGIVVGCVFGALLLACLVLFLLQKKGVVKIAFLSKFLAKKDAPTALPEGEKTEEAKTTETPVRNESDGKEE